MKRILFLLMSVMSLGFVSCYDKVKSGSAELDFSQLFELKAQIEQRLEECEVGEEDGKYPAASFEELERALSNLKEGIKKANANLFILQFEVNNYVIAAKKGIALFDDSLNFTVAPGTPSELFVNGVDHKGHIDFGSSTAYNPANMTVEVWTKYPENFIEFTFGSFLSTFISPMPYKGWTIHYWGTSNSMLRFSPGTDNSNPDLTLPTIYTAAPSTFDTWFHFAAVFDTSAKKMSLYINGELKTSTECADNIISGAAGEESRMWAFVEPKDNSRCMSGYIKKFRLWSSAKSESEIRSLMTTDVTGAESGLVCAWDFTVKPQDDSNIVDITGNHTAKLVGVYKWKPLSNE